MGISSEWLPVVGGVLLGLGYGATIPLGVMQVSQEAVVKGSESNRELVAKQIARQSYRVASISVVRFALAATLLVLLGQLTASPVVNNVVQTGWACLGFTMGLVIELISKPANRLFVRVLPAFGSSSADSDDGLKP